MTGRRVPAAPLLPPRPNPLLRKLKNLGPLLNEECRAVEGALLHQRSVPSDQELMRWDARAAHCLVLLDGMACCYKTIGQRHRQIVAFHVAGDMLNLSQMLLGRADYGIATLTPARVAAVPHDTIMDWTRRYPNLGRLLWRDTLIDAAVFREWVVNVGRRTGIERVAHLLCELATRLRRAGMLTNDGSYALPVTQAELADATGLSHVHVNRVLQALRGRELASLRGGILEVRNWEGLKKLGGFDPTYLHHLAAAA